MSELTDFIRDNKEHFRVSTIEDWSGIFRSGLNKAIHGTEGRHLTPEQEAAVIKYFTSLHKKIGKLLEKNLAIKK